MFIFTQAINFCFVNIFANFDDYVARYLYSQIPVYDVIIVKDILMIHKLSLLLA